MNSATAVVTRELREESRQWMTYWLRVIGAGSLFLVLGPLAFSELSLDAGFGKRFFGRLNTIVFVSIWIFAPLLVADCISREKRDGTLGLLFLTPLTGGTVMFAKGFVHGLRCSALLLAAIPVMGIPFLVGGVAPSDLIRAFVVNAAALIWALGCGLAASLISKRFNRALLCAALFSCIAFVFFVRGYQGFSTGSIGAPFEIAFQAAAGQDRQVWQFGAFQQTIPPNAVFWPGMRAVTPPRPAASSLQSIQAGFSMLLLAFLAMVLLWFRAGHMLRNALLDTGPTKTQARLHKRFCTPILLADRFQRDLRRTLGRNPIAWLEQYSWSSRLIKWGWCFAVLLYEMILFQLVSYDRYIRLPPHFGVVLVAGVALAASNSFARERESGALELLLVTPLSVAQILSGRLLGLVTQILPGLIFYILLHIAFHNVFDPRWVWELTQTIVCVALVGLLFSLQGWSLFARWAATMAIAFFIPHLMAVSISGAASSLVPEHVLNSTVQLVFGLFAFLLLHDRLLHRRFVLS